MIIANAKPFDGGLQLELKYPNNQPSQFAQVSTIAEGERLLNYHNRKFISDKLCSWLRQRTKAGVILRQKLTVETAQLQVLLALNRNSSLDGLCRIVSTHRFEFERLAPPITSAQCHPYYVGTIVPILNFCDQFFKSLSDG